MILLDDDFASIVTGVQEGRRIFDNLKKVSAYMIALSIPELVPFLLQIIIGLPLPCNTILVLCLAVGTDIFPAIGIGFEEPEIDVMTRVPRRPTDHMVGLRLIVWALVNVGVFESIGGMLGYFIVLSDFGFNPSDLFRIVFRPHFPPGAMDVYDINDKFRGNTLVTFDGTQLWTLAPKGDRKTHSQDNGNGYLLDWQKNGDGPYDLRMGFLRINPDRNNFEYMDWKVCRYHQISPITSMPVCWTTEAAKYAQAAYFTAIVFTQISNSIGCKTKSQSIITQPLSNPMMIFGWFFELLLCVLVCYLRPINVIFMSRDLNLFHFGFYGSFFSIFVLLYIETHKFLIRNWPKSKTEPNKPNWFELRTLL